MESISLSEQKLSAVLTRLLQFCQIPSERISFHYQGEFALKTEKGTNLFSLERFFSILSAAIFHAMHEHRGLLCASIATAETDRVQKLYREGMKDRQIDQGGSSNFLIGANGIAERQDVSENGKFEAKPTQAQSDSSFTSGIVLSVQLSEKKVVFGGTTPFSKIVLNAVIADSLQLILDEMADLLRDEKEGDIDPLLMRRRGSIEPLYIDGKSFHLYHHLSEKKTERALEEILTPSQIQAKQEALFEAYVKAILKDAEKMKGIEKFLQQMDGMGWEAKARICGELIAPKIARLHSDQ